MVEEDTALDGRARPRAARAQSRTGKILPPSRAEEVRDSRLGRAEFVRRIWRSGRLRLGWNSWRVECSPVGLEPRAEAARTVPRTMSLSRSVLLVALCTWCAGAASAQSPLAVPSEIPSEIQVTARAGQSFITWRELPASGVHYRVYRSSRVIASGTDLAEADFLGEVDDRSSRNQGRSLASGVEYTWIITPGGQPLAADQGLFVYTIETSVPRAAYYAVTKVVANVEDRTVVLGTNATSFGIFEKAKPPQPVLQNDQPEGQLWAHWVSERDTPFLPALSPWPSRGFNFHFQAGSAAGPHGLVVRLHAAGQTYLQAWPQRFETPADVDGLALSDLSPYTSFSFWYGSQELLPGTPSSSTRVWNYTQQRVLWTVDWMVQRLGASHDPERLYVVGGSMGAIGAMYLLAEYPERFAAALLRNGLYDLKATDYRNPSLFQRLFGDFKLDLETRQGLPILERTNAVFMASRDPSQEWPVLRTLSGRHDETVGWMSAVGFMRGLAEIGRPAVHYFDERTHNPNGYWRPLERTLLGRTFRTRRDRPSLSFTACSLDDEPGDGTRMDGDQVGTLNGYVDYDPATASATSNKLEFQVFVRDEGVLDDSPAPRAWAELGPWRTQSFTLAPGEAVLYTLLAGANVVDHHLLFADAWGHVRTPLAPLDTSSRTCRFERGSAAAPVPLFVGRAPLAGDDLQVVLRGRAGQKWNLVLDLGRPRMLGQTGFFDDSGIADLRLRVPASVPAGTRLVFRGVIGGTPTPVRTVRVQAW